MFTLRTVIACSSSSCIVGFHLSSRPSRSSGPRPSCAGIVLAFAAIGAGNPAPGRASEIGADLRALIRRMSVENLLWGAPRIHGELLKLGFAVAQSTVAKYMIKRRDPSSQGWGTFLRNHAPHIAAMDLFVVRPSALTCSMSWSSSGWPAESLSGST